MFRFLPRKIKQTDIPPEASVMERLLAARGIVGQADSQRFLCPTKGQLNDPFLLENMREAVRLLKEARDKKQSIVVYGDYDVDGMCAASILTDALRRFGAKAEPFIPLREDGYGLNVGAVETLAQRFQMLVTVDLGITNHEEVRRAQELNMTVIVTDHHQFSLEESPADAVISPLLGDYPCPRLCGAGVAFKLAQALLGIAEAEQYLDLAALATVADIVPLTGENRTIVALGLPFISAKRREGIRALLEISAASSPADSYTLGFQLAPRLNAAGRLKDAKLGVRLLMTSDAAEADEIAKELNDLNLKRRAMESEVLAQAQEQAAQHDFTHDRGLIVRGEGWHKGVIGLVAGRLTKQYACPTAALSEEDGVLHGSLRSVPGVNIHRCLQDCDDLLLRYGGHEQAAGVTLATEQYEAFCERLQQAIREHAISDEVFTPSCEYDLPLSLGAVTQQLVQELDLLAPFGCENPPPLFLIQNASLARRKACGADGSHLQITLRGDGRMLDGIAFGMGSLAVQLTDEVDAVVRLKQDHFHGKTTVKCEVEALCSAKGAPLKMVERMEPERFQLSLLSMVEELAQEASKAPKKKARKGASAKKNTKKNTKKDAEEAAKIEAKINAKIDAEKNVEKDENKSIYPLPARGILYVAISREAALAVLRENFASRLEVCWHTALDPLCSPTLLLCPHISAVQGFWHRVVLLDGEVYPGEAESWQRRLPDAEITVCPRTEGLQSLAADIDAGDDAYRQLYRLLKANAFSSLAQAAAAASLTVTQTHAGLTAFAQLELIEYSQSPFEYTLLTPTPCKLDDSPTLSALRGLGKQVASEEASDVSDSTH